MRGGWVHGGLRRARVAGWAPLSGGGAGGEGAGAAHLLRIAGRRGLRPPAGQASCNTNVTPRVSQQLLTPSPQPPAQRARESGTDENVSQRHTFEAVPIAAAAVCATAESLPALPRSRSRPCLLSLRCCRAPAAQPLPAAAAAAPRRTADVACTPTHLQLHRRHGVLLPAAVLLLHLLQGTAGRRRHTRRRRKCEQRSARRADARVLCLPPVAPAPSVPS